MGLRAFIIKRIIYSVALLFFVITLNFAIFMMMPGDPAMRFADAIRIRTPEVIKSLYEQFGLNDPMHIRYLKYVNNMLTGQFGYSYASQKPVSEEIVARLQNTLLLVIPAEIIAVSIGIILGVFAASKRGKFFDSFSVTASLTTYSLPVFWIGMILVLVLSYNLHWFPPGHSIPESWMFNPPDNLLVEISGRLYHLALPWLTLVLIAYGSYLLLTRSAMLETITEDYIVTARAKGLKQRTILFKHALKNASLPIITEIAITFGFMLSGAIITEQVFAYPGLGQWIWVSIERLDYPSLQTIFFVIAVCVIIANFLADILYGVVDPRVKLG